MSFDNDDTSSKQVSSEEYENLKEELMRAKEQLNEYKKKIDILLNTNHNLSCGIRNKYFISFQQIFYFISTKINKIHLINLSGFD